MAPTDLTHQVSQLEERLRHLEAITAPKLLSMSGGTRELFQDSLLSHVQSVQEGLVQVTQQKRDIADFLGAYELLRDLLKNETNEIEYSALDIQAKKEIVLASEDDILQFAEQLKEVELLKDELDVPILRELETLVPKLSPIEARSLEQAEHIARVRERFLAALDSYNTFVSLTSEVFVWYQEVLTGLEKTVFRLEIQQRFAEED
ncbi:hypothetical protein HK104_010110 [Borealophlyctis nickersoniae]|nr:hypothetical protein HK104_010110 [Borealophlyctis nickersoniae]